MTAFEERREQQRFAVLDLICRVPRPGRLAGERSFEGLPLGGSPSTPSDSSRDGELHGRLMPPPGEPQPTAQEIDGLIATLEKTIDEHARSGRLCRGATPEPRRVRAAVKALLDVDIDPKEYLPAEIEIHGFTNIAAALSTSPAFVEQYVNAATAVAHLAVGEPKPKVASAYFPAPGLAQNAYVPGMPLGTRGGIKFAHTFPADGEYRVSIAGDLGVGLYPRAVETKHTLIVLVDRNEQFRADIGGEEDLALIDFGGAPARAELMKRFTDIPLQVTAGRHEVIITFIERSRAADDEQIGGGSGDFSFGGAARVPGITAASTWRARSTRPASRGPRADRSCSCASRGRRRASASARLRSRRISRGVRSAGP